MTRPRPPPCCGVEKDSRSRVNLFLRRVSALPPLSHQSPMTSLVSLMISTNDVRHLTTDTRSGVRLMGQEEVTQNHCHTTPPTMGVRRVAGCVVPVFQLHLYLLLQRLPPNTLYYVLDIKPFTVSQPVPFFPPFPYVPSSWLCSVPTSSLTRLLHARFSSVTKIVQKLTFRPSPPSTPTNPIVSCPVSPTSPQ